MCVAVKQLSLLGVCYIPLLCLGCKLLGVRCYIFVLCLKHEMGFQGHGDLICTREWPTVCHCWQQLSSSSAGRVGISLPAL